jgi:hypothetical protein
MDSPSRQDEGCDDRDREHGRNQRRHRAQPILVANLAMRRPATGLDSAGSREWAIAKCSGVDCDGRLCPLHQSLRHVELEIPQRALESVAHV